MNKLHLDKAAINRWLKNTDIDISGIYLVGGTVRDMLLGRPLGDIDIVCRGAKSVAERISKKKNASLVMLEKKADEPCYRLVDREDHCSLDIAEMKGKTIVDDLGRRDFTINAVAVDMSDGVSDSGIIDPFDGITDLNQRVLRMVSSEAFISDPLRILRAVRFSAVYDLHIEESVVEAMKKNSLMLGCISAERIMSEMLAILDMHESASYFRLMDNLGILDAVLPEIIPMKGCPQNGYHHLDVWQHSLLVLENAENILNDLSFFGEAEPHVASTLKSDRKAFLKLACLLHDAGKPSTSGIKQGSERITFNGHDRVGAEIVKKTAQRLKFSACLRDFLVRIIKGHLMPLVLASPKASAAAKMRWFRKMGDDSVAALILSMADVMSSLGPESGIAYRAHFLAWAAETVREYFSSLKPKLQSPPLITGDDLISLGLPPGPLFGNVLRRIRAEQDRGTVRTRDDALSLVQYYLSK